MQSVRNIAPGENNPRNSEGDFLRLSDGRIIFAYTRFYGDSYSDHAPCDIAALYSADGGLTWSESERIIARAERHGVKNIMSVTLHRFENGDAGLFYLAKNADATIDMYLLRSRDDFESFYTCIHVLPERFRGYYVVNNCRIERAGSGRLIIAAALHRSAADENGDFYFDGRASAYFYYSDDDGFTWRESVGMITMPTPCCSDTGLQEPGVSELPGGALYAYMRTDLKTQYESISADGGAHWTPAQPSRFTSPASPMKIARNPWSGIYYAVHNPADGCAGRDTSISWGRAPLIIEASENGVDYKYLAEVDDDPVRGFCYPAIFFADEHTMLISYCSGGREDKCCLSRTTIISVKI